MLQKGILVLLEPSIMNLKCMHYALSLAERLDAQVCIFQQAAAAAAKDLMSVWLNEALKDLINSARRAGLTISHYIADGELQEEILGLVKTEGIDVIVFDAEDKSYEPLLHQLKSMITGQIIQVKEKDHISYL